MAKKPNPQTCEKCPNRYSKEGCPCWISETAGFMETNAETGEERFITGCFYQVIPKLMIEVVKASNRPAAAVESMRNEVSGGFSKVAEVLTRMPELQHMRQNNENQHLQYHKDEESEH